MSARPGSLNDMKNTLAAKRTALKAMKAEITELAAKVKAERTINKTVASDAKALKAAARAARKAERIEKLEAKLLALKVGPVGVVAKRAARKAGPVTIVEVTA